MRRTAGKYQAAAFELLDIFWINFIPMPESQAGGVAAPLPLFRYRGRPALTDRTAVLIDGGRSAEPRLLTRLAARGKLPKVFFINTSAEYWGSHAALTHTDLDGKRDLAPSEAVRLYHFAGT